MKTRLLGAAVLIALAVLFVPMFFSSKPPASGGDQSVNLAIPQSPDRDLQTKTMSLTPDAAVGTPTTQPAPAAPPHPGATPASSDQLATVNIGSNPPRAGENHPQTGKNTVPAPPPAAPAPAVAGHGSYMLNLSAYASAAGAANLERQVRALGYPVHSRAITQAGQQRTLITAGPFETRTAAEAARLKITQSIPGAPARLEQDASHEDSAPAAVKPNVAAIPAAATPATASAKAGGWAVQLAAMSNQGDANALRDKLRANGFDGFVDSVQAGGKQLWRVRAGPQTQRADAVRVHDQIKAKLGVDGNVVAVP